MSVIVAPSLLSCRFLEMGADIKRLDGIQDLWLHLDIMDGHFVPNLTFGEPVLNQIKTITSHKLDAHFMVTNPEYYVESFKNIGLHNFTFHWEAVTHHDRFIQYAKTIYPSVGISLNPSTPLSVIPDYIFSKIDLILIMSVNPGFGGQKFIEGVVDKIKTLHEIKKKNGYNFHIQVDGGVTDKNAKDLIAAGATNLVAGSYVFGEPNLNYAHRINSLR